MKPIETLHKGVQMVKQLHINYTLIWRHRYMGQTPTKSKSPERKQRPALSPEARENQLIAKAVDLAEEQLTNRTASSQVITHFLKLGSTREKLEKEIKIEEKKLLEAKTEAIKSQKQVEELYKNALNAMRTYSGNGGNDEN